jgi:hypothetical protein
LAAFNRCAHKRQQNLFSLQASTVPDSLCVPQIFNLIFAPIQLGSIIATPDPFCQIFLLNKLVKRNRLENAVFQLHRFSESDRLQ